MTHRDPSKPAADRRARLSARVRAVFADVAGFGIDDDDADTRFVELGMDSLMLTQVALQLRKAFPVAVTFRQLMEDCASVDRLVAMLDARLPPDPPDPPDPPEAPLAPAEGDVPAAASPPAGDARIPHGAPGGMALDADAMRALVDLHAQLMVKQLAMLAQEPRTARPEAALHHDGEVR